MNKKAVTQEAAAPETEAVKTKHTRKIATPAEKAAAAKARAQEKEKARAARSAWTRWWTP